MLKNLNFVGGTAITNTNEIMEKHILGVIPARYASTRFAGKPLAMIGNKPMIRWVYERMESSFDHLYVATDDRRIRHAVKKFGGKVVMTSENHKSGTERCREAMERVRQKTGEDFTHVVNIQGDEPLIREEQIKELNSCFELPGTQIATLIKPLEPGEDPGSSSLVKVVIDKNFRALYFSRLPIPSIRGDAPGKNTGGVPRYKHIGLYAYQSSVLQEICELPASALETAEKLEQLRWLENGYRIQTRLTGYETMGVDTPEDLEAVKGTLGLT